MYHRRRRPRQNWSHKITLVLLASSTFCFASALLQHHSQSQNARVITNGLTINIQKVSPAFAALEDEFIDWSAAPENSISTAANELVAGVQSFRGSDSATQSAASLAIEPSESQATYGPMATGSTQTTVSLKELKISREELLAGLFLPMAIEPAPELRPFRSGRKTAGNTQDSAIRYNGPAERIIKGADPIRNQRSNPTESNSASRDTAEDIAKIRRELREGLAGIDTDPNLSERGSEPTGADVALMKKDRARQVLVRGQIEMTGGLAMTSPTDKLVVYRENAGEIGEHGQVWLKDATYEIFLDAAEGALVGELRSVQGDTLGRGYFELNHLPEIAPGRPIAEKIHIRLRPVPQGIIAHLQSLEDSGLRPSPGEVEVDSTQVMAKSDKEGWIRDLPFIESSTAILRSPGKGTWSTLSFASTGVENNLTALSHVSIERLLGHADPERLNSENFGGIIWGRINKSGRPMAGVKVELLTGDHEARPIYFNTMMIPDPTLEETSANGLYAFVGVLGGVHAVQAKLGNDLSEPLLIPNADHYTTQADISLERERAVDVRVFDAFQPDIALPAYLNVVGEHNGQEISDSGVGVFKYSLSNGLLFVDAEGGKRYANTRLSLGRERRFFFVPLIRADWIEQIKSYHRLNVDGSGSVVGFIQGTQPYKVLFAAGSNAANIRIFYFDASGTIIPDAEVGKPGGGFIAFGVPVGIQTVTVIPEKSSKLLTRVVLIDGQVVNVISHWFR